MLNVNSFRKMKENGEKIVMLTSYDAISSTIAEELGIEILLVGDSMANTVLGYKNTVGLSLEESIFHTKAVRRGAKDSFIVADMPFMTYSNDIVDALKNAARYIQECEANAVKIEGANPRMIKVIDRLTSVGIPVMGHIGLLPQQLLTSGTYKVAGKTQEDIDRLIEEAKNIEAAGAFSLVLECMPKEVSKIITESVTIPTIGIGAGLECDGQVQVITDILGMGNFIPKHAKVYANLKKMMIEAISSYKEDVKSKNFPEDCNSF